MIYNYTFGILSAFGIIFVVLGHVDTNVLAFDGWLPYYSFHMQLFLFISGYFFKKSDANNLLKYVGKKIKSLLIPFYLWNFVYLSVNTILKMISFDLGNTISFYHVFLAPWVEDQPIGFHISTWFLIALFLVEMYNVVLQWICAKLKIENEWIVLGCTLLISIIGCYLISHGAVGGLKVACRSMYCLFFFRLGQWYKLVGEEKDKLASSLYFLILALLQFVFWIQFNTLHIGVYAGVNFENIPLVLLTPLVGIAFWLRVAKLLTPLLKEVKWFVYLGKNTMPIMVHHLFAIFIIQTFVCIVHLNIFPFPWFDVERYSHWVYYIYAPNQSMRLWYAIASITMVLIVVYIKDCIVKRKNQTS